MVKRLPPTLRAAMENIRALIQDAQKTHLKARPYYLEIGKIWYRVKDDPALDEIGIAAIEPIVRPHSVPWLNKCAIVYYADKTGDQEKADRWAKLTGYKPKSIYEPYLSVEILDAWRNGPKPRNTRRRLPLAMTTERLFVRSEHETFKGHGTIACGDCDRLTPEIPDGVIDHIINDPPFGIWPTAHNGNVGKIQLPWDRPLHWPHLWPEMWRVVKPTGWVVICSTEPLTADLISAQRDTYIFSWRFIRKATNFFGPRYGRPLNLIEDIPTFNRAGHRERTYNPQMRPLEQVVERQRRWGMNGLFKGGESERSAGDRVIRHALHPVDLLEGPRTKYDTPRIMYGQRPVSLLRYLIKTHTNPDDVILDITAGSGTTAVACILEGRKFICIERERKHYAWAVWRLKRLLRSV